MNDRCICDRNGVGCPTCRGNNCWKGCCAPATVAWAAVSGVSERAQAPFDVGALKGRVMGETLTRPLRKLGRHLTSMVTKRISHRGINVWWRAAEAALHRRDTFTCERLLMARLPS